MAFNLIEVLETPKVGIIGIIILPKSENELEPFASCAFNLFTPMHSVYLKKMSFVAQVSLK